MSTLETNFEPRAKGISFTADELVVELKDGRRLSVPLAYFPRLLQATPGQREDYEISGGGVGLHWNEIDEDISVKGLLLGRWDSTKTEQSPKKKSA